MAAGNRLGVVWTHSDTSRIRLPASVALLLATDVPPPDQAGSGRCRDRCFPPSGVPKGFIPGIPLVHTSSYVGGREGGRLLSLSLVPLRGGIVIQY